MNKFINEQVFGQIFKRGSEIMATPLAGLADITRCAFLNLVILSSVALIDPFAAARCYHAAARCYQSQIGSLWAEPTLSV